MDGNTVTLTGDPHLGRSGISLKAMIKNLQKEGHGYLLEFNLLEMAGEEGRVIPLAFQPLVQ